MPSSKKSKKVDRDDRDDDNDSPRLSDEEEDVKKDKKDKKDKKEKKDKKSKKREPQCLCCEVVGIKPIPKKSNLRVCEVSLGEAFEGQKNAQIVTNATNVGQGDKVICALIGVKVQSVDGEFSVGEKSVGGIESEGMLCGPVELGWSTDVLPAGLPLILPPSAEAGHPVPPYEDCVAAFQSRLPKESKDAKSTKDDTAAPADSKDKKKKKAAAKAQAKADEEAAFAAALAAEGLDTPVAQDSTKDSKKKNAAKVEAGDAAGDVDTSAALDSKEDSGKKIAAKTSTELCADDAKEEHEADGMKADEAVDAKTLANRKKKEKKKNKAVGAGDAMWAGAEDEADQRTGDAEPVQAPLTQQLKGKKAALQKAAEEARRLAQEKEEFDRQEMARVEEEKRREEEEIRLAKERQQERAARRKAKIEEQKAAGTFVSEKEKKRREQAELLRAQFGFTADAEEEEEKAKSKSAPAVRQKKKPVQQRPSADAEVVEETVAAEQEEAKDDDGWEELAENSGAEDGAEEQEDDSSEESDDSFLGYRSPIVCIMGHVDTGKTKLLDKIRRTNVQEGEAGGITQQIGATFFPNLSLQEQTDKVDGDFDIDVPGMLIIDTPGHESFNNLRTRGSSLCDIAILVIDIMHGLEPQTVESLEILKKRKCPFIIALNKVDKLHGWRSEQYTDIRSAMERQDQQVIDLFETQWQRWNVQLSQRGLNCYLYWDNIANDTVASCVSVVPTSAITGEGVPDLLYMLLNCCQTMMPHKLEVQTELECTVIEVKNIEGLGTTIDVVLVNGTLKEGDRIIVGGLSGAIDTTIRALLTPQPLKEMRVKNDYVKHPKISTSMGIKIVAPGLEDAIAGSELRVVGPDDDADEIKEEVEDAQESVLADFEKQPEGVYVKASTLGSLEALLTFLTGEGIPVAEMSIGDVQKKDVRKALIQKNKSHPEYAMILAFDVKVNQDAKQQAETDNLPIFTADTIYRLFDTFKAHMDDWRLKQREELKDEAVFPVIMKIDKTCVFRRNDPIVVGCDIVSGQLRVGTPICVPDQNNLEIGRVAGIERDRKPVEVVRKGARVCVKIEQNTSQTHISFGRHFDHTNSLYSKISRSSIDALKAQFKDDMKQEDWTLIVGMKKLFEIQ